MSRYTGPRLKVMRALGVDLPGLSRKSMNERPHPPGQHGLRPRKKSGYGIQLMEKQKLRFNYGVSERQLRRLVAEAKASKAQTGEKLVELLERRLDNVVFRAGFAPTVAAARQLVNHHHIMLNGRRASIASMRVRPGDMIGLSSKGIRIPLVMETVTEPALTRPEWLHFDPSHLTATMKRVPEASEIPFPVELQHVVEYYAIRL